MFGYIKPYTPDLRIRENEMFRAIYCGLCKSMGRHTGTASRFTLSYDFVFLAAVRIVLENAPLKRKRQRCMVHPLHKRSMMLDNGALSYCAAAAGILTEAKVQDDINDKKGLKKNSEKLLLPAVRHIKKKSLKTAEVPAEMIYSKLDELSHLEKSGCPSVDETADVFGELLAAVFAYGLPEKEGKIAAALGMSIGRYIYVIDAADDREKDKKSGNYNPLNISPLSDDALSVAVRIELQKAEAAVNLMDFDFYPEIGEIIKNIIYEGLPKIADAVFKGTYRNRKRKENKAE